MGGASPAPQVCPLPVLRASISLLSRHASPVPARFFKPRAQFLAARPCLFMLTPTLCLLTGARASWVLLLTGARGSGCGVRVQQPLAVRAGSSLHRFRKGWRRGGPQARRRAARSLVALTMAALRATLPPVPARFTKPRARFLAARLCLFTGVGAPGWEMCLAPAAWLGGEPPPSRQRSAARRAVKAGCVEGRRLGAEGHACLTALRWRCCGKPCAPASFAKSRTPSCCWVFAGRHDAAVPRNKRLMSDSGSNLVVSGW